MSEIDYPARVAEGAALLDEKKPGWERRLDLEILDIRDGQRCITAQLSGMRNGVHSWADGMKALGLTPGDGGTYVSHGFNAESGDAYEDEGESYDQDDAYAALNRLWRELIKGRLAASPEAPAGA